jgi:23S rRNA (cytosine1962-C5)-methyltransferase
MQERRVILKTNKDKAIRHKHHWIFSGAVKSMPEDVEGELLPVYSQSGDMLGTGYFNPCTSIAGRMVTFDATAPMVAIERHLMAAWEYRRTLFSDGQTNGYRLINGEGDFLPGLIIDCYADIVVIQVATLGMEKLKSFIVDWLLCHLKPRAIYERSESPARKEEGLKPLSGLLAGSEVQKVKIKENGLHFEVDVVKGQKTGFFCDHRLMRQRVRELAFGKRVLNCFAYTGGFTVYAMAGGASHVDTVELSDYALQQAKANVALNFYPVDEHSFYRQDLFDFLRNEPLDYQLVILDPPAFAKKQADIIAACRGYKEINRLALKKMPANSLLLTCSCSFHVDEALFQKVLFQASLEAGREVRIVGRHALAPDHPINICHPEGDYLKSLLLFVV